MPNDLVGMGGPGNLSERDRERGPSVAHDASSHRLDSGSSANPAAPPQHPDRIKSPPSWNEAPSNALPLSLRYSMDAKYKKGFWWSRKTTTIQRKTKSRLTSEVKGCWIEHFKKKKKTNNIYKQATGRNALRRNRPCTHSCAVSYIKKKKKTTNQSIAGRLCSLSLHSRKPTSAYIRWARLIVFCVFISPFLALP